MCGPEPLKRRHHAPTRQLWRGPVCGEFHPCATVLSLLDKRTRTYEEVFADTESIVEEAIEEARRLATSNREELQRLRGKIGELDKKIGTMTRLLVDPDIDATAKRAVSRQMGELEAERESLQNAVAELAADANDNTARLASAVRQALAEAQESLAAVATPTEMRDFVEQYVGPMFLTLDGQILRKEDDPPDGNNTAPPDGETEEQTDKGQKTKPPCTSARDAERSIAGARSLPLHMRKVFGEKLRLSA